MTEHIEEPHVNHWPKARDPGVQSFENNVTAMPSAETYKARWNRAVVKSNWQSDIQFTGDKIIKNQQSYLAVEIATGVPWQLVGCLHALESSLNFKTWLANGDPLTGPTVQVPEGLRLPGNPPWNWTEAAILSLQQNDWNKGPFKNISDVLLAAELYNGDGYITGAGRRTTPPSTSPYLWSGTTEYVRGKYVADGHFDAEAVSGQIGVVPLLKYLESKGMLKLFKSDGVVNVKKATWFEIFRTEDSNTIVGYDGANPVVRVDTTQVKTLVDLMRDNPGANTFRVAPVGKEVPSLSTPTPKPDSKKLNVAYFYQYNNKFEPAATCGLTSAAMLLRHFGKPVTPDELYSQFGKVRGQSPERLGSLYKEFNLKSTHTYNGTYQDIRDAIDAGSPVVLHGYFTSGGHIVCVVGYKDGAFIINDPAGVWDGNKGSGYAGRPENGNAVVYTINSLVAACGRDKELWLSYVI